MVLKNLKIVLEDRIINKGTLIFENGIITHIKEGDYFGDALDCNGLIAMPGFIDIHWPCRDVWSRHICEQND